MKNYKYTIYQVKTQSSTINLKDAVQSKIQEFTDKGYEFHSQVYVPVSINPGCISSLLGGKTQYLNVPLFIFRKEV